jgi:hypothetical protein
MSFGPRLKHLEQQTGARRQSSLVRDAVAKLRAIELRDGPGRLAAVQQVAVDALEGLELPERQRDWDPELRAALSHVFDQLTIDELRALCDGIDLEGLGR